MPKKSRKKSIKRNLTPTPIHKVNETHNGFCSSALATFWVNFHIISLDYPVHPTNEEQKLYTTQFLSSLKTLPCSVCKKNIQDVLKQLKWNPKLHMKNRQTYSYFVWKLHDQVNESLKKENRWTFEQMNQFYEKLRANQCEKDSCSLKSNINPQCVIKYVPQGSIHPNDVLTFH